MAYDHGRKKEPAYCLPTWSARIPGFSAAGEESCRCGVCSFYKRELFCPVPDVRGKTRIGLEELTGGRDLDQQVILAYRVIFQIQILLGPSSDEKAFKAGAARRSSGQGHWLQTVCIYRGCLQALA